MTKEKLKSTEYLVREILEGDEMARNNDDYLYYLICESIAYDMGFSLSFYDSRYFLLNKKRLGFPPFETVRRSRQKLQRKFPELRANEEVEEQRADNETAYRQFVKEEVC